MGIILHLMEIMVTMGIGEMTGEIVGETAMVTGEIGATAMVTGDMGIVMVTGEIGANGGKSSRLLIYNF